MHPKTSNAQRQDGAEDGDKQCDIAREELGEHLSRVLSRAVCKPSKPVNSRHETSLLVCAAQFATASLAVAVAAMCARCDHQLRQSVSILFQPSLLQMMI
eukprot:3155298-Amphidinium_carterae.1